MAAAPEPVHDGEVREQPEKNRKHRQQGRAPLGHAISRMGGRDPSEKHRASSPLELFFDLTFAIAFGVAANQLADSLAAGQVVSGVLAFSFAMFAVIWAWINFSWFASAYDTDDWVFRLVTMLQMLGVLVLAMGLEPMFASIRQGSHVDNRVMVLGYVVMRLALVFQWLRAARQDPGHRAVCLAYALGLAIVQLGWIAVILLDTDVAGMFALIIPLFILEMSVPGFAERRSRTPWHARHIAERYGLLAIIALGECLVGTITALRAVIAEDGWSLDTALVGLAGISLAFSMWWLYFTVPAAEALDARRGRSYVFGYAHMVVFASITATGAGLRLYAAYLEGKSELGEGAVVASVAVPVALFALAAAFLHAWMVAPDVLHLWLAAGLLACQCAAVSLAAAGWPMTLCLALVLAGPVVTIIADERTGHLRRAAALARLAEPRSPED